MRTRWKRMPRRSWKLDDTVGLMDVLGAIKLGVIAIAVILAIAAWIRTRVARMRRLQDEDVWYTVVREPLLTRVSRAHAAVVEDERHLSAGAAYGILDVDLGKDIARLEEAARAAAFVDWDYPLRVKGVSGHRMYLGILAFTPLWFIFLWPAFLFCRSLKLEPMAEAQLLTVMALVGAVVPFIVASRIGGWFSTSVYELGLQHFRAGKMKRAVRRLRQAVKRHPESLRARHALGAAFVELGHLDRAAECALELERRYSGCALVHELFARIEAMDGSTDGWLERMDRAAAAARRQGADAYARSVLDVVTMVRDDLESQQDDEYDEYDEA